MSAIHIRKKTKSYNELCPWHLYMDIHTHPCETICVNEYEQFVNVYQLITWQPQKLQRKLFFRFSDWDRYFQFTRQLIYCLSLLRLSGYTLLLYIHQITMPLIFRQAVMGQYMGIFRWWSLTRILADINQHQSDRNQIAQLCQPDTL